MLRECYFCGEQESKPNTYGVLTTRHDIAHYACAECLTDATWCEDCGEPLHNDYVEVNYLDRCGGPICGRCIREYAVCEGCGEYHDSCSNICQNCMDYGDWSWCDECEIYQPTDAGRWDADGESFVCDGCAVARRRRSRERSKALPYFDLETEQYMRHHNDKTNCVHRKEVA